MNTEEERDKTHPGVLTILSYRKLEYSAGTLGKRISIASPLVSYGCDIQGTNHSHDSEDTDLSQIGALS